MPNDLRLLGRSPWNIFAFEYGGGRSCLGGVEVQLHICDTIYVFLRAPSCKFLRLTVAIYERKAVAQCFIIGSWKLNLGPSSHQKLLESGHYVLCSLQLFFFPLPSILDCLQLTLPTIKIWRRHKDVSYMHPFWGLSPKRLLVVSEKSAKIVAGWRPTAQTRPSITVFKSKNLQSFVYGSDMCSSFERI